MNKLTNPHDRFFKEVFSRQDLAKDFIQNYLPQDALALLDLASLKVTKDSFVEPSLKASFSDMLFQVSLRDGSQAHIYILLEHKSKPESLVALVLLRYMVRIWEQILKGRKKGERNRPLPVIIPLVLYHGAERWEARPLMRLLEVKDVLRPYVPDFSFLMVDLVRLNEEDIAGMAALRSILLLMKYIFSLEELLEHLAAILTLIREETETAGGKEVIQAIVNYLALVLGKARREDIERAADEAFLGKGGEIMTTIAEAWMEEGKKKGLEEGKKKGLEEGKKQGLREAMEGSIIDILNARFPKVSKKLLRQVRAMEDLEQLKALHRKALLVSSPAELEREILAMKGSDPLGSSNSD